jgi:hypothetical protein
LGADKGVYSEILRESWEFDGFASGAIGLAACHGASGTLMGFDAVRKRHLVTAAARGSSFTSCGHFIIGMYGDVM